MVWKYTQGRQKTMNILLQRLRCFSPQVISAKNVSIRFSTKDRLSHASASQCGRLLLLFRFFNFAFYCETTTRDSFDTV